MSFRGAVLLSGGMDSTTALAQAYADGASFMLAVSAKYGSRHETQENKAAAAVVEWYRKHGYDIEHFVIDMPDIFHGGNSSLMGEQPLPSGDYVPAGVGPNSTEVPFRNANLLSAATTLAMNRKCERLYFGAHASDAANWAYPDCTPEFIGAMTLAIYVGTMNRVRLVAPFMTFTKADVVTRAAIADAPLHLTWSCYAGGLNGLQCGVCPTCRERIRAFAEAGFADPVPYAANQVWDNFEAWPTWD